MSPDGDDFAVLLAIANAAHRGSDLDEAANAAEISEGCDVVEVLRRLANDRLVELYSSDIAATMLQVTRILPAGLDQLARTARSTGTPQERRWMRGMFLRELYAIVGADTQTAVPWNQISSQRGWRADETLTMITYLTNEGYIETQMGAYVSITHLGVRSVEGSDSDRRSPEARSSSVTNIQTFHGPVDGSSFQIASPDATQQHVQFTVEQADNELLKSLVIELRRVIAQLPEDDNARRVAVARCATLESEMGLAEPDPGILRESLRSLRAITENLVASGIWAGVVSLLSRISL